MRLVARLDALALRPGVRRALKLVRIAVVLAMIGLLGWQLHRTGWREVLAALPTTPVYYLLFAVLFLALPLSERFIYRRVWAAGTAPPLGVLVRKKIFNANVVGYSGDVYLLLWARERLRLPDRLLAGGMKDNLILSALASAATTMALVGAFIAVGGPALVGEAMNGRTALYSVGALGVGLLLVAPVLLRFRGRILSIAGRTARQVFAIHFGRNLLVMVLQALQWSAALPGTPITIWIAYLTAQTLITRLPFLPNRELLFIAIGVAMSQRIGVEPAAIAGVLLAGGALNQAGALAAFLLSMGGDARPRPTPPPPDRAAPA